MAWFSDKLWLKSVQLSKLQVPQDKILFVEHHLSHAASAMYCSPFEEAAVLTIDGIGEWTSTTLGRATAAWNNNSASRIDLTDEMRFPHSLGLLYSAFTAWLGFRVNSGEYKVMGMAPYGQPRYMDKLEKIVRLYDDGSLWLNMDYFSFHYSLQHTYSQKFVDLFGPPRQPEASFFTRTTGHDIQGQEKEAEQNQYYADVAASIQLLTEEAILKMARQLHRQTGSRNLVMAGGVALNSVANGRLMRETPFEQVYIQPNAGDAGGALGAALYVWHTLLGNPRRFIMEHAYYGESFHDRQVQRFLREQGVAYDYFEDDNDLVNRVVEGMAQGQVVGVARDRFEWGPRALGNRSILADPRRAEMKEIVNTKIKFREPFRPFAPVVTEEDAPRYFDLQKAAGQYPQRFMLMVSPVRPDREAEIPAVSHMGTGRLQTVRREWNPFYYDLVYRFGQTTGTPVLLNTSFNLRSEPIVATPADAFNTFIKSDIDLLVLGRYLVSKSADGQLSRLHPSAAVPKALQVKEAKVAAQTAEKAQSQLLSTALFPYVDRLICPACRGPLMPLNGTGETLTCGQCHRRFTSENGIPLLYWPTEQTDLDNVTDLVKAFYEVNPFPGYEGLDTVQRLVDKAQRSIFAKLLDDQIPQDASVLEVGCGTGQMSNFLAWQGRTVFGVDLCLNSLKLGQRFSLTNMLDTVHFAQMNLFKPIFPEQSFDFVLSNGVLHHTHNPKAAFQSIARLVKPGGYLIVGLYNKYSRIWTDVRRVIFNLSGNRFQFLDPHLARTDLDVEKKRIWFYDQYKHPQEWKHTLDEALGWFDEAGFEFINAIPKPDPFTGISEFEALFAPYPRRSRLEHVLAQVQSAFTGGDEGGLFIVIGQKKVRP